MYINREIATTDQSGTENAISDVDFVTGGGPMVLLGDPGAGKSELSKSVCESLGGRLMTADRLVLRLAPPPEHETQTLFVDGLDEVLTNDPADTFDKVLFNIEQSGYSNWVISCRSFEWRSSLFENKIIRGSGISPKLGRLKSLSDAEVSAFVQNLNLEIDPDNFLNEALSRDALELVRNPQMLGMLCNSIVAAGWPSNKRELYESSCAALVVHHFEICFL